MTTTPAPSEGLATCCAEVRRALEEGGRPLVLLVGGTSGTGKTTLAVRLSQHLEIVRPQSTDMLREVMRMMIPERMIPVLHRSSYDAHEVLPARAARGEDRTVAGYLAQSDLLRTACEAVVRRAVKERIPLLLEGVHLHPALLEAVPVPGDAVVARAIVAVRDVERLRARLERRGAQAPGRRAARYLAHFESIRQIQRFLLDEAERLGVPVVDNDDLGAAVADLGQIVRGALAAA